MESFNGELRDKLLDCGARSSSHSVETQVSVENFRIDYNTYRSHVIRIPRTDQGSPNSGKLSLTAGRPKNGNPSPRINCIISALPGYRCRCQERVGDCRELFPGSEQVVVSLPVASFLHCPHHTLDCFDPVLEEFNVVDLAKLILERD